MHCPWATPPEVVEAILGVRRTYTDYGAKKIRWYLEKYRAELVLPLAPRSATSCVVTISCLSDAGEPGAGTRADPVPWPTCPTEAGAPTSRVSSGPETDVTAIRSPSRICIRVSCSTVAGAPTSALMVSSQCSRASSVSSGYPSGSAQTTVHPSPLTPSAASPGSPSGSSSSGSCPISSSLPAPTRTESMRTCTSCSSAVRPGRPDPTCEPTAKSLP